MPQCQVMNSKRKKGPLSQEREDARSTQQGMNAHLAKPVKIENVKKILCDYSV